MRQLNLRPFTLLDELQNELDSWLRFPSSTGQRYLSRNSDESNAVFSQWMPPVDIREEKDKFILEAEVPGINPKDIQIQMEAGVLTITGEKVVETRRDDKNYARVERQIGKFYRRFVLPDGTADQGIQAKSKNGILEITIPKSEKKIAKTIQIEEAE